MALGCLHTLCGPTCLIDDNLLVLDTDNFDESQKPGAVGWVQALDVHGVHIYLLLLKVQLRITSTTLDSELGSGILLEELF